MSPALPKPPLAERQHWELCRSIDPLLISDQATHVQAGVRHGCATNLFSPDTAKGKVNQMASKAIMGKMSTAMKAYSLANPILFPYRIDLDPHGSQSAV